MSAFICDDKHISALACYAVEARLWKRTGPQDSSIPDQEALALVLYNENAKSIAYRYSEPRAEEAEFEFHFVDTKHKPLQVIKAANCFDYQSCEHEGWEGSAAHAVIQAIVADAISAVPGYSEAAWGWA